MEQLARPAVSRTLSAVAAGMLLGFNAMAVGVVTAGFQGWAGSPVLPRLVVAAVYPLGFVVCLMSGTELFTEQTATAVYPVLDQRTGPLALPRLWVLVAAGNLVGDRRPADRCGAGGRCPRRLVEVATHLVGRPAAPLIASALLAGWLMALGAWLILATSPRISQLASTYMVTFLIGLGDLHHSIAGSVEVFTAQFVGADLDWAGVLRFIALALIGNLIGGGLFVAVLNYGHIRQTQVRP